MNIAQYLDSTYLKMPDEAGISFKETIKIVDKLTQEAIDNHIFAVMIRPEFVARIRKKLNRAKSNVQLGTVIGFPSGKYSTQEKIFEAQLAIKDGADELDFVADYTSLKSGNVQRVADDIRNCTAFVLENGKLIKWIIETAALSDLQIASFCQMISTIARNNFSTQQDKIFVKSSTGYYLTPEGIPNGATLESIKIMMENSGNLPVKAAGGVRNLEQAEEMITLGVKRIGTSAALKIIQGI